MNVFAAQKTSRGTRVVLLPRCSRRVRGFTIVELLIVIVVIAILAAISIVAYTGIQTKARDAQRLQDVKTITKALELYYVDNGVFPNTDCALTCPSPKKINNHWATTSDGSWSVLQQALVPRYISELPQDPRASTTTQPAIYGGFNYDYIRLTTPGVCGTTSAGQTFLLAYRLESQAQKREFSGNCPTTQPGDYESSEYVSVKN